MDTQNLVLVSHVLCPYVQRAAIVLAEKGAIYTRRDVDLGAKPEWFNKLSPLGKTPVLVADGAAIFESAVICEYLDETLDPRLHPEAPLQRAQHRSWIEFSSALLGVVWTFYSAKTDPELMTQAKLIGRRFEQLEEALRDGPYFDGARFSIVDAAFGPVFRYFDIFDAIDDFGFFAHLPKVAAWRHGLAERTSVRAAVRPDYPVLLQDFLKRRDSALSRRMSAET